MNDLHDNRDTTEDSSKDEKRPGASSEKTAKPFPGRPPQRPAVLLAMAQQNQQPATEPEVKPILIAQVPADQLIEIMRQRGTLQAFYRTYAGESFPPPLNGLTTSQLISTFQERTTLEKESASTLSASLNSLKTMIERPVFAQVLKWLETTRGRDGTATNYIEAAEITRRLPDDEKYFTRQFVLDDFIKSLDSEHMLDGKRSPAASDFVARNPNLPPPDNIRSLLPDINRILPELDRSSTEGLAVISKIIASKELFDVFASSSEKFDTRFLRALDDIASKVTLLRDKYGIGQAGLNEFTAVTDALSAEKKLAKPDQHPELWTSEAAAMWQHLKSQYPIRLPVASTRDFLRKDSSEKEFLLTVFKTTAGSQENLKNLEGLYRAFGKSLEEISVKDLTLPGDLNMETARKNPVPLSVIIAHKDFPEFAAKWTQRSAGTDIEYLLQIADSFVLVETIGAAAVGRRSLAEQYGAQDEALVGYILKLFKEQDFRSVQFTDQLDMQGTSNVLQLNIRQVAGWLVQGLRNGEFEQLRKLDNAIADNWGSKKIDIFEFLDAARNPEVRAILVNPRAPEEYGKLMKEVTGKEQSAVDNESKTLETYFVRGFLGNKEAIRSNLKALREYFELDGATPNDFLSSPLHRMMRLSGDFKNIPKMLQAFDRMRKGLSLPPHDVVDIADAVTFAETRWQDVVLHPAFENIMSTIHSQSLSFLPNDVAEHDTNRHQVSSLLRELIDFGSLDKLSGFLTNARAAGLEVRASQIKQLEGADFDKLQERMESPEFKLKVSKEREQGNNPSLFLLLSPEE